MEISDIKDRDSLKDWLKDKPVEWSLIIGLRMILRHAPLAFTEVAFSEKSLGRQRRANLVLTTFRVMFLAKVFFDYSDKSEEINVLFKPSEKFEDAFANLEDSAYSSPAKFALKAAIDFFHAFVNPSDRLLFIGQAVENACHAIRLGDVNYQNSPMYAASSIVETQLDNNFWSRIKKDADWLNQFESTPSNFNEQYTPLMSQPLWLGTEGDIDNHNLRMPDFMINAFDALQASALAQTTSFGLITDWYRSVLQGKKGFLTSAEKKIALMPKEDWEGDPVEVMDRVAAIAGWSRDMTRGGDFYLEDDVEEKPYNASTNTEKSYFKSGKIKHTLKENKNVALSMCQSLLLQIAEYKEKIRGKNHIEEQTRNDLIAFLNKLEADLKDIVEAVITDGMGINDKTVNRIKSRLNRFNSRFKENLPKYFEPEHLADITPPVSIILGCGSIGALFGGPVGFGIGAFVGKLVTQEAKPGQSSDKVREMYEQEETNNNV